MDRPRQSSFHTTSACPTRRACSPALFPTGRSVDRLLVFSSKILMQPAASSALRCSSVTASGQIALGERRWPRWLRFRKPIHSVFAAN